MAYDFVIANGLVVTASETRRADVAIVGDKIAAVAPGLAREGAGQVIDAGGKYVMPGGIDVHTHLDMPLGDICSSDDFETGTRAAAFGGTTTIIDFATPQRGQTLHQALACWQQKAAGKAVIDYGFHCVIPECGEGVLAEMDELAAEGVTSFKVFMAYPGRLMLDDAAIFRLLQRSTRNGSLICVHAENGGAIEVLVERARAQGRMSPRYHALTRPAAAEAEAVNRAIALAEMAEAPVYIVHVSCRESLERIAAARARSLPVYAETCPQYLFLSAEQLDTEDFSGAKYVFTPPPRTRSDQAQLWGALSDGTLQVVSTDHCPFNFRGQKDRGGDDFTRIPNGGPGIEHRLSLSFSGGVAGGKFSPNRFVELVSTAPARLFGLYPRKGEIAHGSDADLVVFDPVRENIISAQTHHMRVDYSLYEGMHVRGCPELVFSRGRLIVSGDTFHGQPGQGEFLRRGTWSEILSS